MTSLPPAKSSAKGVFRLILRVVMIVSAATLIGMTLNRMARRMEQRGETAGFAQGMLQGAMMPCAMPNLLVGKDVTIYAANNNGRNYKLGYTVGVNLCGMLFFGLFFYRVRKLLAIRRQLSGREEAGASSGR